MDTYLEVDLLVVEVDDGEGAEALSICIVGLLAKHLGSGVFYFLQKSQIVRQSARWISRVACAVEMIPWCRKCLSYLPYWVGLRALEIDSAASVAFF